MFNPFKNFTTMIIYKTVKRRNPSTASVKYYAAVCDTRPFELEDIA